MPERVWVVSELYYPEETGTGYLLTGIAEGLARHFTVGVLCAQPTYAARGARAPSRERRNGVAIYRCPSTTMDHRSIPGRLANLVTISATLFLAGLLRFRRSDSVLVVTNPPALPFVVLAAARLRGATCSLILHDVYPEVLVAAGLLRRGSLAERALAALTRRLYQATGRIVVLGRDMEQLVRGKISARPGQIVVIPNWGDVELAPDDARRNPLLARLGLSDKFVVQYAGNMGRTHAVEDVIEAAYQLRSEPNVHFLFLGWGAKQRWLEEEVTRRGLANVSVLGKVRRDEQPVFLNACDVAIVPFVAGMAGVSVPSRMYNIMAVARPIIATADPTSEIALVVTEEKIGWVLAPGRPDAIVEAIREARGNLAALTEAGRRARQALEAKYTVDHAICAYVSMLSSETPASA